MFSFNKYNSNIHKIQPFKYSHTYKTSPTFKHISKPQLTPSPPQGQPELGQHPPDVGHAVRCALSQRGPGENYEDPRSTADSKLFIRPSSESPRLASLSLSVCQVRSPQGKYKQTSKGAVMLQPKADELRFMTKSDGCVNVHPSSVNYPVRMTHTEMHFRFGSAFQFQHIQRFLSIYYVFQYILLYFSHGRCDTTTAPTWCTTRR